MRRVEKLFSGTETRKLVPAEVMTAARSWIKRALANAGRVMPGTTYYLVPMLRAIGSLGLAGCGAQKRGGNVSTDPFVSSAERALTAEQLTKARSRAEAERETVA
jgi:hypothetical protein